jgi:exosortase/archaeosortase family protein
VPTDTPRPPTRAAEFVLRAVAASLAFFGLLRLPWTETHLVLPLVRLQGALAVRLFGTPALPVEATLACSGADAMALCLGALIAYPAPWRARAAGAAGGVALILGLNTLRIGTLGRAAATPGLFNALHLYIWPAALTLAIAGYVFGWMRVADRRPPEAEAGIAPPSRRFVALTVTFLIVFAAAAPLYLESPAVLALAGFIARAAAATLAVFGVSAHAAANVLWTPRGGFLVSQECISTPLIPVYLAAVCAYAPSWRLRLPGLLATLPLFTALGVVRLLVVALPDAVASPLFFVHAFYQLLLGAVLVVLAALWRHGGRAAPRYAAAGVFAGVLFAWLLGPLYTRVIAYPAGVPLEDPQGAIAMLPAFQVGLYLALSVAAFMAVGWVRFVGGLAVLGVTQAAGLAVLQGLAAHPGLTAPVPQVRGWAVAGPLLIFAAVVHAARPRR